MALIGLILLFTGFVLNVQVLGRSRQESLRASQILHSLPWQIAMGLVVVGAALLVLPHA
jgi:hypothetical protein